MTTAQNVYVPPASVPTTRYAGFGIRLVAYLIDVVILMVVFAVVIVAAVMLRRVIDPANVAPDTAGTIARLACGVIGIVYYVYFWGRKGATPGKKLLHLRVRLQNEMTGEPGIGDGKAFVRLIGYAISGFLLYLPFLIILMNPQKRGLHDFLAGTEVVRD